jgi:uncharacterized protein (TIGR00251 family)
LINFTEKDNALIFFVRVIPRSSQSEIVGEYDGALKVKLNSPPVDGAANEELIKLLAREFGVSKGQIEILSGNTSKLKQVKISNASSSILAKFQK